MYVKDINDIDGLKVVAEQIENMLYSFTNIPEGQREQLMCDLEDIHARIQEIDPTAGTE